MGTKIKLTVGVFIALVLTGGVTYLLTDVPEGYNFYECQNTEPSWGALCWDLSEPNEETGLVNRCYWNQSEPKRYKKCSTGWILYEETEVNGTFIDYKSEGVNIDLAKDKTDKLKEKGIKDPEIKRKKNRFNMCVFELYEEGGLKNNEIKFPCSYCVQYDWVEETEECYEREITNYTEMINQTNNETYYFEELINQTTCNTIPGYNNSDCVNYYSLTDEEIDIKKFEEANKKLEWIAEKLIVRDSR